jgi:hypothetical protein
VGSLRHLEESATLYNSVTFVYPPLACGKSRMSKKARFAGLLCSLWLVAWTVASDRVQFRVGAAAVAITPLGQKVAPAAVVRGSGAQTQPKSKRL